MTTPKAVSPRVFISYSHDNAAHEARVLALADSLQAIGIDAVIDRYTPVPPEGWPLWMENNLDRADFILMVCTETYYNRVMRQEKPGIGKGVQWEGNLICNCLYNNISQGDRFLPILLEGGQAQYIPGPAQGHAHFTLKQFELSDAQFEALYRHLTGQPSTPKPQTGSLVVLPPHPRPPINP